MSIRWSRVGRVLLAVGLLAQVSGTLGAVALRGDGGGLAAATVVVTAGAVAVILGLLFGGLS